MKIFNWVHRKFHQKDGKKDIELKVSNEIIGHHDTQILLQDASFAHMLDIWNGGMLTIGTFGFDPLMKNVQDQQSVIDIESLEEEEEEEEYYSVENEIQECEIPFNDEGINEELYPLIYANIGDEVIYNEDIIESNNNSSPHQSNTKMMKKERITLADLFSADSDYHHHKADHSTRKSTESEIFTKKSNSSPQVKNGLSFAKKLIPRVKDEPRPIQKLQKLMTKVLKRKVHPDIETKLAKNNSQVKAASMLGLSCVKHVRVESSVSLLLTDQDVTA
ncbi:protein TILLER ANGLE CONTROL 1-like [Solanum dulcamara]|uniref:protein TILLER ANGLE CONTROL 1-like n=1 Tax=Solanum dulcamara TaxID=45834 RepID=UPI0024855508|nr:protein TILLER ANGLE CONTROL 1-like [Solanum dulcamara]